MGIMNMTDGELEIMEALWSQGKPVFLGELLECFNERTQKDWKKQTMNTFLFRMQQKNLLKAVGGGRYKMYEPLITREEYMAGASRFFLKWTKDRITILHDGIGQGQVEIPELDDIIPSVFGKDKGIRIKFQEIGYESILIGGMSARVIR